MKGGEEEAEDEEDDEEEEARPLEDSFIDIRREMDITPCTVVIPKVQSSYPVIILYLKDCENLRFLYVTFSQICHTKLLFVHIFD